MATIGAVAQDPVGHVRISANRDNAPAAPQRLTRPSASEISPSKRGPTLFASLESSGDMSSDAVDPCREIKRSEVVLVRGLARVFMDKPRHYRRPPTLGGCRIANALPVRIDVTGR